jgi:MoaA/NifB/PqqE/SkfB family radical SAM enzyme
MTKRRLRALQVEVTSRCTRRCAVCPRAVLGERWVEGDFSEALWDRLRPDLRMAHHLHLQGWGEPLLHPRIEAMAADGRAAGCRVGLTTNGDLLAEHAGWMVAGPLDVITLSVAGVPSNPRLRDGALTDDILAAAAELARRRRTRRRPRLHVSYLLTRDNAGELVEMARDAAEAGIDAVLVNHLDCTPTAKLRAMAAFSGGGVDSEVHAAVIRAKKAARACGIELRPPVLEQQEMLTCDLDPTRITSVRWDGRVAPCVMLNLPVDGPLPRCTRGRCIEIEPPVLGHLQESTFGEILDAEPYRSFTAPFRARLAADAHYREWGLLPSGWGVVGIADLERAWGELERGLAGAPFPGACAGCPKAEGW